MKELTIVKEFRDCDDFAVVYREGQKHLFEEGRAKRIVSLGLAVETSDSCDKAVCAGKSDHDDTTNLRQNQDCHEETRQDTGTHADLISS